MLGICKCCPIVGLTNLNWMNLIGCSTIMDDSKYVTGHNQIDQELEELHFCPYFIYIITPMFLINNAD